MAQVEKHTDYQKRTESSKTDRVDNPVICKNADVSSSHSATLYIAELRCEENAVISVDHTATLIIAKLICKNGKLNVSYTSTLNIQYIECSETLDIQNSYTSTVYIATQLPIDGNPSNIGKTTGLVNYSSTGQCGAWINRDEVRTENLSSWTAAPLGARRGSQGVPAGS